MKIKVNIIFLLILIVINITKSSDTIGNLFSGLCKGAAAVFIVSGVGYMSNQFTKKNLKTDIKIAINNEAGLPDPNKNSLLEKIDKVI